MVAHLPGMHKALGSIFSTASKLASPTILGGPWPLHRWLEKFWKTFEMNISEVQPVSPRPSFLSLTFLGSRRHQPPPLQLHSPFLCLLPRASTMVFFLPGRKMHPGPLTSSIPSHACLLTGDSMHSPCLSKSSFILGKFLLRDIRHFFCSSLTAVSFCYS